MFLQIMVFVHDPMIVHGNAKSLEPVLYIRKQTLLAQIDQRVTSRITGLY